MKDSITVSTLQGHCCQADRGCGIPAHGFDDRLSPFGIPAGKFLEFFRYDENTFTTSAVGINAFDGLDNERCVVEHREELFGKIGLTHGPEPYALSACQYYRELLNGVSPLA
jgi:hypothetical protein